MERKPFPAAHLPLLKELGKPEPYADARSMKARPLD
jgi:hypothetical protein